MEKCQDLRKISKAVVSVAIGIYCANVCTLAGGFKVIKIYRTVRTMCKNIENTRGGVSVIARHLQQCGRAEWRGVALDFAVSLRRDRKSCRSQGQVSLQRQVRQIYLALKIALLNERRTSDTPAAAFCNFQAAISHPLPVIPSAPLANRTRDP